MVEERTDAQVRIDAFRLRGVECPVWLGETPGQKRVGVPGCRHVPGEFVTPSGGVHGGRLLATKEGTMQIKSTLRAGKLGANHNEGLKLKSKLRAGRLAANHNETMR
jgi:hypothetical protein